MKRLFLFASCVSLLTGCTPRPHATLNERMQNPLFAERYAEDFTDAMANLFIDKDPLLDDESKKSTADALRLGWKKKSEEAMAMQRQGATGPFVEAEEYVRGHALYLENTLYFDPAFITNPGPSLRVYLSTIFDPRDGGFPDDAAIDLGPLQTPYGDQVYAVPDITEPNRYLSVVLWDTELERLYGFAKIDWLD